MVAGKQFIGKWSLCRNLPRRAWVLTTPTGAVEGHAYPPEFVPKMVQWYREGKFPIDKLAKFMPADDFEQGLKEMHDGTTIKPILCWS